MIRKTALALVALCVTLGHPTPAAAKEMSLQHGREAVAATDAAVAEQSAKALPLAQAAPQGEALIGQWLKTSGTVIIDRFYEKGSARASEYFPGQAASMFTLVSPSGKAFARVWIAGEHREIERHGMLEAVGLVIDVETQGSTVTETTAKGTRSHEHAITTITLIAKRITQTAPAPPEEEMW